jgi:hypothetical protein
MGSATPHEGKGPKEFTVIVNGREHKVSTSVLTFDEIVRLAFPNPPTGDAAIVTITYRNADSDRREGTLVEGQRVTIKNGTIFNVTATTRS